VGDFVFRNDCRQGSTGPQWSPRHPRYTATRRRLQSVTPGDDSVTNPVTVTQVDANYKTTSGHADTEATRPVLPRRTCFMVRCPLMLMPL
jgi:hypothetical protein